MHGTGLQPFRNHSIRIPGPLAQAGMAPGRWPSGDRRPYHKRPDLFTCQQMPRPLRIDPQATGDRANKRPDLFACFFACQQMPRPLRIDPPAVISANGAPHTSLGQRPRLPMHQSRKPCRGAPFRPDGTGLWPIWNHSIRVPGPLAQAGMAPGRCPSGTTEGQNSANMPAPTESVRPQRRPRGQPEAERSDVPGNRSTPQAALKRWW